MILFQFTRGLLSVLSRVCRRLAVSEVAPGMLWSWLPTRSADVGEAVWSKWGPLANHHHNISPAEPSLGYTSERCQRCSTMERNVSEKSPPNACDCSEAARAFNWRFLSSHRKQREQLVFQHWPILVGRIVRSDGCYPVRGNTAYLHAPLTGN